MHDFATCPQCNVKLQAFYLKNAAETELLEIDGCRKCGGQWFDRGELERVIGKKLDLQWQEGSSFRFCARCKEPMKPWKAAATQVELEQCESCRSIFLDAGELRQLGAPAADRAAREALVRPGEFECLKCFKNFSMSQGNAWGHGLVCRGCVPMPGEEVLDRFIPANRQRTMQEQSERETGLEIIGDILSAVLRII